MATYEIREVREMLKEIIIESRNIKLPGSNSIDVHGLTLEDITSLLGAFKPELTQIFNSGMDIPNMTGKAPLFTATVIALAVGEPEEVDKARRLPFGAQLIALEAVWDLTLPDDSALGKLIERLQPIAAPLLQAEKESEKSPSTTETGGKETSQQ